MANVGATYKIVVPIPRDQAVATSNVIKGKALEKLASSFLRFQSYEVIERLRDVGTEIDLLCKNKLSFDIAIVECKVNDKNLSSDVVNKLHTDASLYNASHGWIIATGDLTSEARTRLEKLNGMEGRNRFQFFSGPAIVPILCDAGLLSEPIVRTHRRTSSEFTLVLLDDHRYWTVPVLDGRNLRPTGYLCWDAQSGQPISPLDAPDLSSTDFPNADLAWLEHSAQSENSDRPRAQAVIEVIPGDEWSDYRPSRPDDFVGRVALINEVAAFFESIKNRSNATRILGIKGRSGWGKSSLALKLAHQFASSRIYVLPVDCRAANSAFYADMAVSKAISQAAREMFFGPLFAPTMEFRSNPFEEPSTVAFLRSVEASGGLICLIFDQFEAIIHRPELKTTLERMRELALFADELRSSIVIGFSWKTDGTVGSDNPGYYLWHSLSDRRRDFEVDRFTRDDADQFISLALRSARINLPRSVTHFIIEQYAGLPWLLKKLIKHCIDDIKRTGSVANLTSFFNIATLFQNDLQELSQVEVAAVQFVAREAPVELHVAEERCGSQVISSLMDRRLIIKSGSHLSLYWDIFRDYVINGQIPKLPNTYIPTLSVRKIRSVVRLTTQNVTMSYSELATSLGISLSTADNTVRDLSNMGLVDAQRILESFDSLCKTSREATGRLVEFLKSHTIYMHTKELIESGNGASLADIEIATRDEYSFVSIDKRTLKNYIRKIIVYCIEFGLLGRKGRQFVLSNPIGDITESQRKDVTLLDDDIFRGAAPPSRVLELLIALRSGECTTLKGATTRKLRNAVFACSRLGLVIHRGGQVIPVREVIETDDLERLTAEFARRIEPMHSALINLNVRNHSSDEVGSYLSDLLELNWSPASCRRYGLAIRDWCIWVEEHSGRDIF